MVGEFFHEKAARKHLSDQENLESVFVFVSYLEHDVAFSCFSIARFLIPYVNQRHAMQTQPCHASSERPYYQFSP